jgi:hypothetical protein
MDPVEEVAYRNRPPLLEDVSIQGPLRIPIADAMQTLEEREAIEADFRWYRWSKFAAPWLFFCLLLVSAIFCLTAWQEVGSMRTFVANTVYNSMRPWGVPRHIVRASETGASDEGGMPKTLRNLRIAGVFHGFFGVLFVVLTLLVKPRPRIRMTLNYVWALLLFACFVMEAIAFALGIGHFNSAKRCPWNQPVTHEKCTVRKGIATIAIALDAGVFCGALTSVALLLWYNATGDWKLLRTGWRERERDAETEIVRRTDGADKFLRKVRPVRIAILSLALVFTLCSVIVLTIFIVLLHMDHQQYFGLQMYRGSYRGKDLNEQPGWSARNTRLRYGFTIMGFSAIVLNYIPFTHRAVAYLFAVLYFIVSMLAFVAFGLDVHEMQRAHDMQCPVGMRCRDDIFVATAILDFFTGLAFLFYILYEYGAKVLTSSRWSGRGYCPHEIYKHDTKLDSMRPVRCELTGHVMTAKEYVYRYRFIAGTGTYYEDVPVSQASVPYIPEAILPPPVYMAPPVVI